MLSCYIRLLVLFNIIDKFCHCFRGVFRNVKKSFLRYVIIHYLQHVDKLPEKISRANYHVILGSLCHHEFFCLT